MLLRKLTKAKIFSLIAFICFSIAQISFAQDPFLRNDPEIVPTPTALPVKRFPGYGSYREAGLQFCQYLSADGHQERWNTALERAESLQTGCKNCRQLYKVLTCKPPGRKAKNIAVAKVPMPSTELIASGSELFINLAADQQVATLTAEALRSVFEDLSQQTEPLSDNYFGILTAYIRPPLAADLQQTELQQEGKKKIEQKKALDKLF